MNTGLYMYRHTHIGRYVHAHTEHYVSADIHMVKDSEKLPICQILSQCLLRLAEKLFYSSADKRCRGQLCPSRLRDTTSKRDHKIFFILNFKGRTCQCSHPYIASLFFFNFWHLIVGNIFLIFILYIHNWYLNLSFLSQPQWTKRTDGSSWQSLPYFKTSVLFTGPSSLD